jgi:hypothetical protein
MIKVRVNNSSYASPAAFSELTARTMPSRYWCEADPLSFSDTTTTELKTSGLSPDAIEDLELAVRFWKHELSRTLNVQSSNRKILSSIRSGMARTLRQIRKLDGVTLIRFEHQAKSSLEAACTLGEYANNCLSSKKKIVRGGRLDLVERIVAVLSSHGIGVTGYGNHFRNILWQIYMTLDIKEAHLDGDVRWGLERLRQPYKGAVKQPKKQLRLVLWDKAMEAYAEQTADNFCVKQEEAPHND